MGALFSMYVFFEIIRETQEDGTVDPEDFPRLKPTSQYWQQSMLLEMFCTFLFVSNVLLVKDEKAAKYSHYIGGHSVTFLGCAIQALALTGMKLTAAPITGGSINPAISVAQKTMDKSLIEDIGGSSFLWRVYMLGPFLGALLSGFCSLAHRLMLNQFGPQTAAEKAADAKADAEKDAAEKAAVPQKNQENPIQAE